MYRGTLIVFFITLCSAASSLGFRFDEGGSGGLGGGLFGDAGLVKSVPRLGRKRSLSSNPFNSRFRFRFNNLAPSNRIGSAAQFRFQGNDVGPSLLVKKRMGGDDQDLIKKEAEMLGELAGDLSEEVEELDNAEEAEDNLRWYKLADKYWREYMQFLQRQEVMMQMAQVNPEVLKKFELQYRSPLIKYMERQRDLAKSRSPFSELKSFMKTPY